MQDGNETYGLIKDGNVATKENMTYQTGVPLPLGIMDFLFEGWYDEIKDKISPTSFQDKLGKFKLLHPLPNLSLIHISEPVPHNVVLGLINITGSFVDT